MNNLSEKCSYCRHSEGYHDMFYLDCTAPEDYRFKNEECPYFESGDTEKSG